jgi:ATP-dependent exoDNAse (exonuclease V) alpha subunit
MKELDLQGAKNAAKVALTSRKNKENQSRSTLLEKWKETGRSMGWSSREVDLLIGKAEPRTLEERATLAGFSVVQGIEQMMESQSYFTEREAILHAAENAQGRCVGIAEVMAATEEYLRKTNPKIVALGIVEGEAHYTTIEQYRLEKEFKQRIEAMADQPGLDVSEKQIRKAIDHSGRDGKPLTKEQEEGLRHILQEPGRISTIIGDAGTGKTTMLRPVKDALERSGYQVVGAALAGKAAQGLQQGSGIESRTITSLNWMLDQIEKGWNEKEAKQEFLNWVTEERKKRGLLKGSRLVFDPQWSKRVAERSWKRFKQFAQENAIGSKTVVVIDEAGMADTRQLAKLLGHIDRNGAKAVFIGDEKQLQAVTQGGGFKFLSEVIRGKRLTEVFRQKNPGDKKAVENMAKGKVKAALEYYAAKKRLKVLDERPLAKDALIDSWAIEGIQRPDDHLILAGMNVDVDDLNQRAQKLRFEQGYLGQKSIRIGQSELHQGDRIVLTRNDKKMGVNNGDFGTLRRFNAALGTVTVELDGPGSAKERTRTFKPSKYQDVKLSYAVTTHKAQGMTVGNSYILTDDKMMDRELSYVQISRSEEQTRIFTTRDEAGDDLHELSRQMERSRQKQMAIALEQQAARQQQGRGR